MAVNETPEPFAAMDFAVGPSFSHVEWFKVTRVPNPEPGTTPFQFSRIADPKRWPGMPRRSKGWRRHVRRLKAAHR